MNLPASILPHPEIFDASMPHDPTIGTDITIHHSWNTKALPPDISELRYYSTPHTAIL